MADQRENETGCYLASRFAFINLLLIWIKDLRGNAPRMHIPTICTPDYCVLKCSKAMFILYLGLLNIQKALCHRHLEVYYGIINARKTTQKTKNLALRKKPCIRKSHRKRSKCLRRQGLQCNWQRWPG
jgi:hypothetical protein